MKKISGRLISLMIAGMMILSLTAASAEEGARTSAEGLKYELRTDAETGESYAVVKAGTAGKELTIPAEIDGYTVREVAADFVASTKGLAAELEKLTIEKGITIIGDNAFEHCTALTQVSLPESLVSVGEAAFVNIGAECLALPENAVKESSGFWYCSAIRQDETGEWEYGLLGDGSAVITSFFSILRSDKNTKLVIPDTVDGIQVTMVANVPLKKVDYSKARKIKQVTLPKGLKAVEHLAFDFFESMTQIKLPAGLTSIGYGAFRDCRNLRSITIPNGVTRIGDEAFRGCRSMAFPTLPPTLDRIGKRTFYWCKKLSSATLPESIRTVGEMAFAYSELKSLKLNDGLEIIEDGAFIAHRLRDIVIPASVRKIGNLAFDPENSTNLKKVTFSSASTQIGVGVFGYDNGWSTYYRKLQKQGKTPSTEDYDKTDPANWIDYYRDRDNYGQNTLTVTCYPGSNADRLYQYHVAKVYLKGQTTEATTAPNERVLQAGLYTDEDQVSDLIVPEGVVEIADSAFAGLTTLNRITLPATLTRIGAHAFEQCIGLKEIVMQGKTMSEIGEAAFSGCGNLKSITIPDGVAEISDYTFYQCRNLKIVKMPESGIRRIGEKAFAECSALTDLFLNNGLESIGAEAFYKSGLNSVQIPDSVTFIGTKAFYMSDLTRLKLPEVMEEISEYVFAYSMKLNIIMMPKQVKRIGKGAFMQCPLGSFTLPEGLERIEEEAFAFDGEFALQRYGRKKTVAKLKTLNLPASLKYIGSKAFTANDVLTTITFAKGSQLEEIGESAFSLCFRLKTIVLLDSLQKVGNEAFLRCVEMSRVDLGNGITELGDRAFEYCLKLKSLTAPEGLKKIGNNLLKEHGKKLVVKCPEGSMMENYVKDNYPEVTISYKMK